LRYYSGYQTAGRFVDKNDVLTEMNKINQTSDGFPSPLRETLDIKDGRALTSQNTTKPLNKPFFL